MTRPRRISNPFEYWLVCAVVLAFAFILVLNGEFTHWDSLHASDLTSYWMMYCLLGIVLSGALACAGRMTWGEASPTIIGGLLLSALTLRVLVVCFSQPVLSDDIWRYIHDGATFARGPNPYLYAPADFPADQAPVPKIVERINNPELVTIYQPTSQWLFAGLDRVWQWLPETLQQHDPDHSKVFRLGFVCFDMAIIGLILFQLRSMGRSMWWAVAYAWHPLAISEVAGSGHQDVIGIAFLLLSLVWAGRLVMLGVTPWAGETGALSRMRLWVAVGAGVAFGLAVGVKPLVLPIALVLAWVLRDRPKVVAVSTAATVLTGVALYLPFILMDGGLTGMVQTMRAFVDKWAFNGSVYDLVSAYIVGKPWVDYLAVAVLLAVIVMSLSRRFTGREPDAMRTAGAFLFASLLVSSTVHPWYLLWALAFLPMYFSPALWVFSLIVTASYAAHFYEGYRVPTWVVVFEYLPVYGVLTWELWKWIRNNPTFSGRSQIAG